MARAIQGLPHWLLKDFGRTSTCVQGLGTWKQLHCQILLFLSPTCFWCLSASGREVPFRLWSVVLNNAVWGLVVAAPCCVQQNRSSDLNIKNILFPCKLRLTLCVKWNLWLLLRIGLDHFLCRCTWKPHFSFYLGLDVSAFPPSPCKKQHRK